jgi:hypothetical protein
MTSPEKKRSNKKFVAIVIVVVLASFGLVFGVAASLGYFSPEQTGAQAPASTAPSTTSSLPVTTTTTIPPEEVDSQGPPPSASQPTARFEGDDRVLDAYGLRFVMKLDSDPMWAQVVDSTGLTDNRVILIKGGCQFEVMAQCPGLVVAPEANDPFKNGECAWNGVYDNRYYGSPSKPVEMVVGTVPAQYIKLTQCTLDGSIVENPDILHLWRFANGTVVYDQDLESDDLTSGTDQILPLVTRSR